MNIQKKCQQMKMMKCLVAGSELRKVNFVSTTMTMRHHLWRKAKLTKRKVGASLLQFRVTTAVSYCVCHTVKDSCYVSIWVTAPVERFGPSSLVRPDTNWRISSARSHSTKIEEITSSQAGNENAGRWSIRLIRKQTGPMSKIKRRSSSQGNFIQRLLKRKFQK